MVSSDPEEQTEVLFPTAPRSGSQSHMGDMELSSQLSALEEDGNVQGSGFGVTGRNTETGKVEP